MTDPVERERQKIAAHKMVRQFAFLRKVHVAVYTTAFWGLMAVFTALLVAALSFWLRGGPSG
jgi:hypothetical protein